MMYEHKGGVICPEETEQGRQVRGLEPAEAWGVAVAAVEEAVSPPDRVEIAFVPVAVKLCLTR